MLFLNPLLQGIFLKRYKRFFADIQLDEQIVVAHVANTGSLKSCSDPGRPCLISPAQNPERKLKYSLEAIQVESGSWVGVNTSWPNILVAEAYQKKLFPQWKGFDRIKNEVKVNEKTRIDFVLENSISKKRRYIEVKNVSLARGDLNLQQGIALFPDAVTERGQKHLRELILLSEQGHETEIFFCVQRSDCTKFSIAEDIDPEYGSLLRQAKEKGVEITAAIANFSVNFPSAEINLSGKTIPFTVL